MSNLIRVPDVAARYAIAESTLYTWRAKGTGPRSFKLNGVVVYDEAEVAEWAKRQAGETARGGAS